MTACQDDARLDARRGVVRFFLEAGFGRVPRYPIDSLEMPTRRPPSFVQLIGIALPGLIASLALVAAGLWLPMLLGTTFAFVCAAAASIYTIYATWSAAYGRRLRRPMKTTGMSPPRPSKLERVVLPAWIGVILVVAILALFMLAAWAWT